jgi:hypothetical protein
VLLAGLEPPAAPFSGGPPVVPPLVTSEGLAVSADVGSLEEAPVGVVSEVVVAEPPAAGAGGSAAAVLSVVVTGSPDVGCGSDVVGGDESVAVEPALGVAVAVELGAAVESIASCGPVVVESTGVAVEVGAVPAPVAVVVSSAGPTDPTSARAVATSEALSIQQTSVATTPNRRHRPRELRLCTQCPYQTLLSSWIALPYPGIGPRTRRNLKAVRKLRTN